ncbi:endolytic transglycosylase MltG [Shewanella fidelis]|uniref:Endolytic murein transglycosylase n=1 Tax=Shewanella fidelis TaxID=173509 RepID=A0AAW8NM91_9GAMM|nr:endolytic transglycosylase MltG [Shewanella fidelis]MDR8523656.1 endolytic transglycosylase MltG [Shewanella fidelis]MDW4810203.1 endolytic transglycosylase MltG [Shewanella fidelis]MDW4814348.1 endolytic transglycosylase MltG [Shewanella fidelis]MDW4818439.1 endolytic transglycosylase MltG [Shewanella fidelis]MDW4823909.1 endolytic transglycosylase MltG [Shewanella fidelis]
MKKAIIGLFATLFTLLTLAAVAGYWGYQTLLTYADTPIKITQAQELDVKRGTNFNQFISLLESEQLIEEGWKLKWLVRIKPELAGIRSGLYELEPTDTLNSLLAKVISGKEKSFAVTLLEGQTVKEWQLVLEQQPRLTLSEDIFAQVLRENGDDSGLPEGKFFPDTYHYIAGSSERALLNKSYKKMQLELDKAWQGRQQGLPLKSAYELLILASIIEKETGKASERPWIAAVFINRLRKGMRLQTDPTVIYGMGDRYKGNITRKDLRETTAFNTYRINGLPPTPIAAPSLAALQAAAHPADVDYFYFVSRNDGSHVFSKTLNEHNRAVNKYQRNR